MLSDLIYFPQHIWWEGTAQLAVVFDASNDSGNYELYVNELIKTQDDNGGIPYSFSEDTNLLTQWPYNMPYNSAAGTAWFYFLNNNVNPFIIKSSEKAPHYSWMDTHNGNGKMDYHYEDFRKEEIEKYVKPLPKMRLPKRWKDREDR